MRFICSDFCPDPPQKRKAGRPKIKSKKSPKSRRMSDITKRKISESSKKFSICKLCSKQCRGFRGVVDHMHRDHRDYKPWRCHICHERTTFVKTLYRHLRQEHHTKYSPCHVCGKTFSRAQSLIQHFKQVSRLYSTCLLAFFCRGEFRSRGVNSNIHVNSDLLQKAIYGSKFFKY